MLLTIYDKAGTKRADVAVNDSSTQSKEVQGIFFLYTLEFLFLFFWLAFYLAFRWRKVLYAVIMYEGESCITTHLHV